MSLQARRVTTTLVASMVVVLLVPPVVFLLTGLAKSMPVAEAFTAMVSQYAARPNLLVTGVIGLIPLAVVGLFMWIHRRKGGDPRNRKVLFRAAMIVLVAVLAWSNYEFWRVFLPQRISPGFPHGLELFIGPVIFAPVAILAALLAAWLILRIKG